MSFFGDVTMHCDFPGCSGRMVFRGAQDASEDRAIALKHGWTQVERPDLLETLDFCPLHPSGRKPSAAVRELEEFFDEISRPPSGMYDSVIEEIGRAAAKRLLGIAIARVKNALKTEEPRS